MSVADLRRKAWDEALLLLLYERDGLRGEELLTAIIIESNDALARLRETGQIEKESEQP